MSDFKKQITRHLSNIPGWRTKRKIVVIESDDWGSVRIKDRAAYNALKAKGLNVDNKRFDQVDSLESNLDLEMLFETLQSVKDAKGFPAKFTPMCLVGNPDFNKIKEHQYEQYFFQPLEETILDFPQSSRLLEFWRQGAVQQIFVPQLHGREHLNIRRYMEILQSHPGKEGLRYALDFHSVGPSQYKGYNYPNYLGALHPTAKEEIKLLKEYLLEAGILFSQYLGYSPEVFMAPNAEEPKDLEESLQTIGVKYLTRAKRRIYPLGDGQFSKEWNFMGKINDQDQLVLNRNAFFEPCQTYENQTLESCMKEIEIAFKWGKPAVISSHRVNYVGSIDPTNREKGLFELKKLLRRVVEKWPEIEFMTSLELGSLIRSEKQAPNV